VLSQLAMLLAVLTGPGSALSFAQDQNSAAPWQAAENHPAAKTRFEARLENLQGRSDRKKSTSFAAGSAGRAKIGPQYVQPASHISSEPAKPAANVSATTMVNAPMVDLASANRIAEPETIDAESVPAPIADSGNFETGGGESEFIEGDGSEVFGDDFSLMSPAPDDPVFHEGRDALIYEGKWNNRINNWYAVAQVTLLHRQSPAKTPISYQRVIAQNTSGVFVQSFQKVQEARVLHFGVEPGMRVTLGRNLFTDIVNRQHSIEFTFLGLNHWRDQNDFIGDAGSSTATRFVFPGLYSNFPLTQGGFNAASQHQLFDSSNMNNYELNYKVAKLPRPDRIVQLPNGKWARCGTPCILVSGLVGFRAVTIDEHFLFQSNGVYTNGEGAFSGSYKMDTSNNLFGAQIGGDAIAQYNLFSFGMRGKVGVYGDAARRSANIAITDPVFGNQSASFRNFTNRTSCVADLNFIGTVRLRPGLNFRVSYDFMWCGGLINAPEQQQYNLVKPYPIVNTGRMLFQGVGLGFDAAW
jgi:hypothetical protein